MKNILKKYDQQIINSIINREYLGTLSYEIEEYQEHKDGSIFMSLIFQSPVNEVDIIVDEKGPNDESLKLKCIYDDPRSALRMSIIYNNNSIEVAGTNLLLSNDATHEIQLINQDYDESTFYNLNRYVQEELDINSYLDFKRLFEEIGHIYVKHNIFE